MIVHLIGSLHKGGAESQLYRLACALRRRGWEQSVVAFETGGWWKEPLEDAGIPVHEIARHPFKPWRQWQLRSVVKRERPSVLVSWSAHTAVYGRFAGPARRIFNVRGDLTVDPASAARAGLRWVRGALERSDYVVGNSRWGFEALRRAGVRLPPHAVIENIVPAPGRARPARAAAAPRIAALGSLKKLKAYDVLLRALALVDRPFELALAGEGPERERLQRLAGELGLGRKVRFLGQVDEPGPLLASAHLFVHPSLSEGLSNAVLEAMGQGLPVAAARSGGTPEIVQDGITGFLVPPGQTAPLAAALRRLLEDAERRGRLGEAGLRLVRQRCGEDGIARRYEAVLHKTVAGPQLGLRRGGS